MPNYSNSIVRNLNTKLGEIPSVLDFGAVGDGSTDATTSIQNGLNSVAARGGGELLLTPGTFKINGTAGLDVPSGVTLVGQGTQCQLVTGTSLGTGVGVVNFSGSNSGLRNISIDGGTSTASGVVYSVFSSDPMSNTLTHFSSVWAHPGASRLSFSNIDISHTGGYAMLFDADTADVSDVVIEQCHLYNNRPHAFGTTTGSTTFGAWTGGIFFRGDCRSSVSKLFACRNVVVRNCSFKRQLGNCLWMHSKGFDIHHQNFTFENNFFEDCGLDAILAGNLQNGRVCGNRIHRVGYVTFTDSDTPTPSYPGYTFAVALDNGFNQDVVYESNVVTSVVGEFVDFDGVKQCVVKGNRFTLPASGTPEYTEDSIASYPSGLPVGIGLGDSQNTGGPNDNLIEGNLISGCPERSISLYFAKRCTVRGNHIIQSGTGTHAPIQLGASDTGDPSTWNYNNIIEGNYIEAASGAFGIAEVGDATAYGSATATNTIFNNRVRDGLGEFLRNSSSSSVVGVRYSSNEPSLTSEQASIVQHHGSGILAGLQFFHVNGTSTKYAAQLGLVGPLWNVAEATPDGTVTSSSGRICTGSRSEAGILNDFVFSGKQIADGFFMLGNANFSDTDANYFDATYGMLRYVPSTSGTGAFEISVSTDTSGRVWTPLGGGASTWWNSAGTNIYNVNAGGVGIGTATPGATLHVLNTSTNGTVAKFDTPAGGYVVFGAGGIYSGSTNLSIYTGSGKGLALQAGTTSPVTIDPTSGYISSPGGFYSSGTAANTVQVPAGGVTALSLVSVRNDGDSGITLSRGSATARDWGFNVTSDGYLKIYDRTGLADRMTFLTNGQTVIWGTTGAAGLQVQAGWVESAQGFLSTATNSNLFQATSGGGVFKWVGLSNSLRLASLGTAVSPDSPPASYGGLGHRSGATYWYWNGSSWASVDFSASSSSPPGSNSYLIFNDSGSYGASSRATFNKTSGAISIISTAAGVAGLEVFTGYISADAGYYSSSSAANAVNLPFGGVTALSLISVRNDANDGWTIARTSSIARQYGVRIDSSGNFILRDATAAATRLLIGTAGTATFSSALSFASTLYLGATTVINSSNQHIGALFNATNTGTNFTFQNSNSNFLVNGNGDVSAAGTLNILGLYRHNSSTIVDSTGAWVGAGVDCRSNGVGCIGFNYWNGSYYEFGQTKTVAFSSYLGTLTFKGGVLVAAT